MRSEMGKHGQSTGVAGASTGAGGGLCPPASPIVAPTEYVVNDFYHPQEQPVIHPIEYVNQHHCVPVPNHIYTCTTKDVFCSGMYRGRGRHARKRK